MTNKKNVVGAPIGNQNHIALKDPEIRQKAYKSFCEHLSKGLSYQSWFYEDDLGNGCVGKTMLSYIKENPIEFPSVKKEIADSKGFAFWEGILIDSASGKNKDASTASLQMIMRNKYGWDKPKEEETKQKITFEVNYTDDTKDKIEILPSSISETTSTSS